MFRAFSWGLEFGVYRVWVMRDRVQGLRGFRVSNRFARTSIDMENCSIYRQK